MHVKYLKNTSIYHHWSAMSVFACIIASYNIRRFQENYFEYIILCKRVLAMMCIFIFYLTKISGLRNLFIIVLNIYFYILLNWKQIKIYYIKHILLLNKFGLIHTDVTKMVHTCFGLWTFLQLTTSLESFFLVELFGIWTEGKGWIFKVMCCLKTFQTLLPNVTRISNIKIKILLLALIHKVEEPTSHTTKFSF